MSSSVRCARSWFSYWPLHSMVMPGGKVDLLGDAFLRFLARSRRGRGPARWPARRRAAARSRWRFRSARCARIVASWPSGMVPAEGVATRTLPSRSMSSRSSRAKRTWMGKRCAAFDRRRDVFSAQIRPRRHRARPARADRSAPSPRDPTSRYGLPCTREARRRPRRESCGPDRSTSKALLKGIEISRQGF